MRRADKSCMYIKHGLKKNGSRTTYSTISNLGKLVDELARMSRAQ